MKNILNYTTQEAFDKLHPHEALYCERWGWLTKAEDGGYTVNGYRIGGEGWFAFNYEDEPDQGGLIPTYQFELGEMVEATAVSWDQQLIPGTGHTFTGLEGKFLGVTGVFFEDNALCTGDTSALQVTPYDCQYFSFEEYNHCSLFIDSPVPGVALVEETEDVYYNPYGLKVLDEEENIAAYFNNRTTVLTWEMAKKMATGFFSTSTRDEFRIFIPASAVENICYTFPPDPRLVTWTFNFNESDGKYKIYAGLHLDEETLEQCPDIVITFTQSAFDSPDTIVTGEVTESIE